MKKIYSFFLLLGLLLSVGNAWAETYSMTPNQATTGSSSTNYVTSLTSFTYDGISWKMNQWNPSSLQVRTNQGSASSEFRFYNTSAFSGKITQVVITFSALTIADVSKLMFKGGTAEVSTTSGGTAGTWNATAKTLTWTPGASDEFTYFAFYQNGKAATGSNYLAAADAIVVTYEDGGQTLENNDLALTNAPIALTFDLYNDSDPRVINYTTSSTGAVSIADSEYATFTINQTNKTITVTPTAVTPSVQTITVSQAADQTYNAGSATFTISIANSAPVPNDNISDITAAGTYTVQGTIVAKSQRGFIVGDGTGYVYYYNQNYTPSDYSIGDMVKLSGSVSAYGGVFEFTNTATITAATESSYVAEDPTVLTGAQMDTRVSSTTPAQLSNYIQYQGKLTVNNTYYNITSIDGATTAKGSISFPLNTDFTSLNGKVVTVKGYYVGISSSTYYNTMIGSIEEVPQPIISFDPNSVSVDAAEHDGTINVSYINFTLKSASVVLCDGEGAEATYSWLLPEIDNENNIYYVIGANMGIGRTAYMKVIAKDSEDNDVYSGLITITQGACAYASLPFAFDGGRAGINNTPGLTQEGLGTDYSSSPSLKFDGTGDVLVLKINENPGILLFDIKGNGFSSGSTSTFKIQTSENGEDYSDLETYTELSDTQTEHFNLASNVRYIKWIYTEKGANSGGNVALGNIKLLKPVVLGTNGYSTFAADFKYTVSGAEVYEAALNGAGDAIILTKVENAVVPANEGIILKGTAGGVVTITPSNATASDFSDNELVGVLTPVEAEANWYVLATIDQDGITKFHPCNAGVTIPANKAYMEIGQATAPGAIRIIENATNIMNVDDVENAVKFIENGKLFIKKNGVIYNAVGAVVK